MTWFAHHCWFCGRKSKEVVFIVGDSNYQCENRAACQQRYDALSFEERLRLGVWRKRW